MSLTLYTYPNNPRAFKALVCARFYGIDINVPEFKFGVDNKTPEFLAKNPLGKVPILDTPQGAVFESNSIARYVARQGTGELYGKNALEASQIDQWLDFALNEIEFAAITWLGPILGFLPFQKAATDKAKQTIKASFAALNTWLSSRTFLVGQRISLADIVVACSVLGLYTMVLDAKARAEAPHVMRWFTTVVAQPFFAGVVGPVAFAEKEAQAALPKKEKKPEAEAPKKKQAEEETTAAASSSAAEEEEEEQAAPQPVGFQLDEWKRQYSNTDTRTAALPWLWANMDRENYSIWFCKYKYNDELKVVFKTSNLCGGFIQRADGCRRYAFGSMLITGTSEGQFLSGAWMWQGQGFLDKMKEVDDSEHYEWTKADIENPADRALVEDYFAWDKDIDGQKVLDGKVFK